MITGAAIRMKWIAIMMVAVLVVTGCDPQRRIQKAVKTVTFNDTAFDHVGRLWLRFNPCFNDTIFNSDTIITERAPVAKELDADSLRKILCDSGSKVSVIYDTFPCIDRTIIQEKIVIDHRATNVLRDSLHREQSRSRALEAELHGTKSALRDAQSQLIIQTKEFGKQLTKRTLIMLIPIVLILLAWYFSRRIPKIF